MSSHLAIAKAFLGAPPSLHSAFLRGLLLPFTGANGKFILLMQLRQQFARMPSVWVRLHSAALGSSRPVCATAANKALKPLVSLAGTGEASPLA